MSSPIKRKLVDEHMSLARAIAAQVKKQVSPRLELDDLVGYAVQGLLEASERFDDGHGAAFSTFAYHRIRGAVYDGLRHMGHLPRAEYAKVRAAARANEYLANLADRERGARDAAGAGGPPAPTSLEDEARALHEAMAGVVTSYVTSLEALGEEGHQLAGDELGPEDRALLRQAGAKARVAIAALPDKERHFIEKHYFEGKTLLEAGQELGLSKSWASRLHARAIELLRAELDG